MTYFCLVLNEPNLGGKYPIWRIIRCVFVCLFLFVYLFIYFFFLKMYFNFV